MWHWFSLHEKTVVNEIRAGDCEGKWCQHYISCKSIYLLCGTNFRGLLKYEKPYSSLPDFVERVHLPVFTQKITIFLVLSHEKVPWPVAHRRLIVCSSVHAVTRSTRTVRIIQLIARDKLFSRCSDTVSSEKNKEANYKVLMPKP